MIHSLEDVTITTTGTPQALSSTFIQCNWFQVQCNSVNADARIGDSLITATRGAIIGTNTASQFAPPAGNTDCYDLAQVFIRGTSGDTYTVIYNR